MEKFGEFGGSYVPQELNERLDEIKKVFEEIKDDKEFKDEYLYYLKYFVGRPSPVYYAKNLTVVAGGAKIYLKREDLNHTGAHKINNAIGQVLLARRMGKTHIIAETGAGQHGVATATVCTLFKMKCTVFMGKEDIRRQKVNVEKMKNEPLVSVIIPNYNYAHYLEERMDSVLNQTFQDFEIIILDDASTDGSIKVIEKYKSHPKIASVVINGSNSGSPFKQWKKGIQLARGKYIWIVEADDVADLSFLETTVRLAETYPDTAICHVGFGIIDSYSNPIKKDLNNII